MSEFLPKPNLNKPFFRMNKHIREKVAKAICWMCDKTVKAEEFRGVRDVREYSITGICQRCQDLKQEMS